jgi:predicted nucleotidyltransferase
VQRRSYGSLRISYLNSRLAVSELAERAELLVAKDDRVLAVGLFGSLARGSALPSSDADILIVLVEHPLRRWFDRIPEYSDVFSRTSLPAEVFPYTQDELERGKKQLCLIRTALTELIHLAGDKTIWELPAVD